jgi:uncharacterized membrane protein YphA (DoxX/SURF4 family)
MKSNVIIKSIILDTICLLYVLLFVYAAVSKFLDFENFQVQLGQSPLLSAFAEWVSWAVPIIELSIVLLLIIPKWRKLGLIAALFLMSMFTSYIFIILNYSSFVPCSCGGILEKMGWNTHLIFNIIFIILAVLAIALEGKSNNNNSIEKKRLTFFKSSAISILSGGAIMAILFLSSEEIIHHENPFIRRYPQHPIMLTHTTDLKFNSYYFSGYVDNRMYLGNYTDPLHVLSVDTTLLHRQVIKISFDPKNIPFKMAKIAVRGSYFYLMDGRVPAVFRGKTTDWKITKELKGSPYFTLAEPVDSTRILFRSNNGKNSAHTIGVFTSDGVSKIKYNTDLLQQQLDGVFDTDGMLLYGEKLQKMVYLYYYRNEFTVADKYTGLIRRGHTIDTITKAKIKVAYLKNGTERKMAAPPQTVNAHATISEGLLFVHSKIKGRYEDDKLWDQASIIDVYDLQKKTYLISFPIYGIEDKKLQSFFVTTTHLYALIGNQLVVYELKSILKKEINMLESAAF